MKHKTVFSKPKTKEALRLLKIRGKVVFADGSQFYYYNEDKEEIVPYTILNEQLPSAHQNPQYSTRKR